MIRLMTHNVWNCDDNAPNWEKNGEDCSAEARIGSLVRVYRETMPDIIGCQEVSRKMADLLVSHCQEAGLHYTLIFGRYTPVMYRADKFELVDNLFFTYPETIDGMEGTFNDSRSKSMNACVFREKSSGKLFLFTTTHLWWKLTDPSRIGTESYQANSDEGRTYQMQLLLDRINKMRAQYGNCPCVVVGDLNTAYHTPAIKLMFDNGFRHAHDIATEYADNSMGYHFCFPAGYETHYYDQPFEDAIDHMLIIGETEGAVKRFERYSPEYYLPISDHSPALMDWEL